MAELQVQECLDRLRNRRLLTDPILEESMRTLNRSHFILPEMRSLEWSDIPLPFLRQPDGAFRVDLAPHLLTILVQLLEIEDGHRVLLFPSRSGFLATLVSRMVGPSGKVSVLEPQTEAAQTTREYLNNSGSSFN